MIFSALLATSLAAPAYDAATTGLITYHLPHPQLFCVTQFFIQGQTSAVVRTAFSKTNEVVAQRVHTFGQVISETNQNYQIQINTNAAMDPNYLLSLYVGNIDANFHPGTWNAYVKFVDDSGKLVKFTNFPDFPSEALYSSVSPVLKKAYGAYPICPK
jgi:hypothetical protein